MGSQASFPSPASFKPLLPPSRSRLLTKPLSISSSRRNLAVSASSRRDFLLLLPSLAAASAVLHSLPSSAADDKPAPPPPDSPPSPPPPAVQEEQEPDASAMSRVYDATVLGEPQAVGREARGRVWERLMAARVVYLGEAEPVPDGDAGSLELEIVTNLATRCAEAERSVALALEAFPCDIQEQLNQFMDGSIDGNDLRSYTSHWAPQRWQEYEPLLNYCRDNGVKLVACGTPLEFF